MGLDPVDRIEIGAYKSGGNESWFVGREIKPALAGLNASGLAPWRGRTVLSGMRRRKRIRPMPTCASSCAFPMRHWLLGTLAAVLLLVSGGAWACPICFTGQTVTLGQRLAAADRVVLAMP